MDPLEQARALFTRALDHHNHQEFAQAETLYRQALELVPERISVLVNLSATLIAQNRHSEALVFCKRALAIDPRHHDALQHLEQCRRSTGTPLEQLVRIDVQLSKHPEDAGLHNNRGLLLHDLNRHDDAIVGFDNALRLSPSNATILLNRGRSHEALDRPEKALNDYLDALRVAPRLEQAGYAFARLLVLTRRLPDIPDIELDSLLVRMIEHPWIAPQLAAPVILDQLRKRNVLSNPISAPTRQSDLRKNTAPSFLSRDENESAVSLQIALLKNAVVVDPDFEELYAESRRQLLFHTAFDGEDTKFSARVKFHCALAMQCFLNEYIYACTADEIDQVHRLAGHLSNAIKQGSSVSNSMIAAVACYMPLHAIAGHEQLLDRQAPDELSELIRQQIAEPLCERQIASGIHRLTDIQDSVSTLVREQYEQSPYPRWSKLPVHIPKASFPDFLKRRLPYIDSSTLPGQAGARITALNAGCGTGQHPINMTLKIDAMQLLAIDLSIHSLAHAARKSQEIGLSNISFAQADILELRRITTRFDLIESMGVLHHLADPSAGLTILCELLKDNGVIRLGLYSELGRRSIVACRQDIARRGIECTAASIRAYRKELKAADTKDPRKGATRFADFYSLSECRDLLFHVQEHRFTIPGLRELLDVHRLEFLGFDLEPDQLQPFVRTHPEPGSLNDLHAWAEHEQRHPDTFGRMYILWARKMLRAPV